VILHLLRLVLRRLLAWLDLVVITQTLLLGGSVQLAAYAVRPFCSRVAGIRDRSRTTASSRLGGGSGGGDGWARRFVRLHRHGVDDLRCALTS
jgi:hypothetical protein